MTPNLKLVLFLATLVPCAQPVGAAATAAATDVASAHEIKDNGELARMYEEDQSDRQPIAGKQIDWAVVGPRDKAREARVKELYTADLLKTGTDYHRAAMVLQHAGKPEDYLLAHELCVIAIYKGVDARWLAAASEDRFLRSIGRPQRFGTQSGKMRDSPWSLGEIDSSVTDSHRAAMKVPSLDSAKARLAKENESLEQSQKPNKAPEPTP